MGIAALIFGTAAIWLTRTIVLRRRRSEKISAALAGVLVGAAWAFVPLSFALASSEPPNWAVVVAAAVVLSVGSGLTTYVMTKGWDGAGPAG